MEHAAHRNPVISAEPRQFDRYSRRSLCARRISVLFDRSVKSDSSSGSLSTGSSSSVRARTTRSRWALDLSEGRASSSTFLATGHALLDVVPTGYTPGAIDGYNREVRGEGDRRRVRFADKCERVQ